MKDIFVYGTLRVGKGNFRNFSRRYNIEVIEEGVPIYGYQMSSAGIPFTYFTEDNNDVVYGDILRVDDEGVEAIDRMELGAGYYISEVQPLGHSETYRAYLYRESEVPRMASVVTSGNFKSV